MKKVLSIKNPKKTLIRLFTDEKVYTKLSFGFQCYLIEIIDNIKEKYFFIKINKLLDQEDIVLNFEIRKLLKEYTDYAITVEEIINSSSDGEEAISKIICIAEYENVTELDKNTKLVLIHNLSITAHVVSIKEILNSN